MTAPSLVLASSSPRRRDLLARIGVAPARIASPDIDETPLKDELPRAYALRLAQAKAAAVTRGPDEIVLAGDTTVALGRRIDLAELCVPAFLLAGEDDVVVPRDQAFATARLLGTLCIGFCVANVEWRYER